MTEPNPKKIFELYDLIETKLEELDINFDEFVILYQAFRNPAKIQPSLKKPNPFPWVTHAGAGWS